MVHSLIPNMTQKSPFDDGKLYDFLFDKFDYGLEFYVNMAKQANGPVLDIACGTGRILIPCLKAGIDIEGLDLSSSLLDQLKEKADKIHLNPTLYNLDMRRFELKCRYRLIIIPFNSFVHCLTTDEQISTLSCCYQHLENDGILAFDTFFPGLGVISGQENCPILELEENHPETGLPIRMYDTRSFDRVEQIQSSKIEIQELDLQGEVLQSHLSQTKIRWIYKYEMELILRSAGFKRWEIFGSFDRQPLKSETDAMVVCAIR